MKYVTIVVALLSYFLLFCSGCENSVGYKYTIEDNADLSNLLVFEYHPSIFGIDTTDFSVKGHIRIDNMSIGGVAKLPSGGVAFTSRGSVNGNIRGGKLYVTDKNCKLLNTYDVCNAPMGPNIINNRLLLCSSATTPGDEVTFKFQIYETGNFTLQREYLIRELVDGWLITNWNEKAYFGVNPMGVVSSHKYGYVVELDLNTLDTTIIGDETPFFDDAELIVLRHESSLYIFNILEKDICIYDFQSKQICLTQRVSEYPQILATQSTRLTLPYICNGILYGNFQLNGWDDGRLTSYMAKFNSSTLELIDLKKLDSPAGYTRGNNQFYAGRYLVMQFLRETEMQIVFYDIETGNIEHEVTLPGSKYDYH